MTESGPSTPCSPQKCQSISQLANISLKRLKQQHVSKQNVPEGPAVSPTLTPALPEPMPPTTTAGATAEEIAFFDKVKKFINNKHTMNEFLKICNLFSQDLIDKAILVHRAQSFIGGNPDLMNWFKKFLGYENKEDVIENKVRPATGRVSLANCRGLGPSYRLLPKLVCLRIQIFFFVEWTMLIQVIFRNV